MDPIAISAHRTPGDPVDRARAPPGREPPRGPVHVGRGTSRRRAAPQRRSAVPARETARRRAPADHPRPGETGRHAVAGRARVPRRGDVHGAQRARESQGCAFAEDPLPMRRRRRRRRGERVHTRRRVRAGVPDAQAHRPVPRRQDHASMGGPKPAVVAAKDQARVRRAGAAGAQDDDGRHLVPGASRGFEKKGLEGFAAAVAGGRGGRGSVRRARGGGARRVHGAGSASARDRSGQASRRLEEAAGGDGEAPSAVRGEAGGGAKERQATPRALARPHARDDARGVLLLTGLGGGLLSAGEDGSDRGRARGGPAHCGVFAGGERERLRRRRRRNRGGSRWCCFRIPSPA